MLAQIAIALVTIGASYYLFFVLSLSVRLQLASTRWIQVLKARARVYRQILNGKKNQQTNYQKKKTIKKKKRSVGGGLDL